MRPNEVFPEPHIFVNPLRGEALYMLIWVDILGVEVLLYCHRFEMKYKTLKQGLFVFTNNVRMNLSEHDHVT
jgi:hypothetical protein